MLWFIYFLCGIGVMLALDDDRKEPIGIVGSFAALVCIAVWPLLFMFAVTTALRSLAEHQPRDIVAFKKQTASTTKAEGR